MPFVPVKVEGDDRQSAASISAASPARPPGKVAPAAHPEAVLWDQPLSTVNQAAVRGQDFTDYATYSSFLADDFVNPNPWAIDTIFVPGDGWNGLSTLLDATALTWQIYADCAGVPCGDPSGGGNPPVWTLTLRRPTRWPSSATGHRTDCRRCHPATCRRRSTCRPATGGSSSTRR